MSRLHLLQLHIPEQEPRIGDLARHLPVGHAEDGAHVLLREKDLVILDMDAGIGRGTTRGVDVMIAVVEPGLRSVEDQEARTLTSGRPWTWGPAVDAIGEINVKLEELFGTMAKEAAEKGGKAP